MAVLFLVMHTCIEYILNIRLIKFFEQLFTEKFVFKSKTSSIATKVEQAAV